MKATDRSAKVRALASDVSPQSYVWNPGKSMHVKQWFYCSTMFSIPRCYLFSQRSHKCGDK